MTVWPASIGYKVGDVVTAMVPRRDIWSRFLRFIRWGVRLEEKTFVCTHVSD